PIDREPCSPYQRNTRIFGDIEEIPKEKLKFILQRKCEFLAARSNPIRTRCHENKLKTRGLSHWFRPPPPLLLDKADTDGSYHPNADWAGAGGLLRNHHGKFIYGFVAKKMGNSAFQAELLGISHAGQRHWDFNLIIECDAMEIVSALTAETPSVNAWNLLNLQDWEVKVQLIQRDQNFAADWLAKTSTLLQEPVKQFSIPPHGLQVIIDNDIITSAVI
ncbi:LOW QUALITY PROTEIN: hypothetical protein V2J09_008788, partial [Rumex salicifolius]